LRNFEPPAKCRPEAGELHLPSIRRAQGRATSRWPMGRGWARRASRFPVGGLTRKQGTRRRAGPAGYALNRAVTGERRPGYSSTMNRAQAFSAAGRLRWAQGRALGASPSRLRLALLREVRRPEARKKGSYHGLFFFVTSSASCSVGFAAGTRPSEGAERQPIPRARARASIRAITWSRDPPE